MLTVIRMLILAVMSVALLAQAAPVHQHEVKRSLAGRCDLYPHVPPCDRNAFHLFEFLSRFKQS